MAIEAVLMPVAAETTGIPLLALLVLLLLALSLLYGVVIAFYALVLDDRQDFRLESPTW